MDKALKVLNNQLDRANDFRCFALLGSFIFFLDYLLILKLNLPVLQIEYTIFYNDAKLGEILVFFALFAFFLSFLVPLIRIVITYLVFIIPFKWLYFFYDDPWKNIKPKDYYYDFQLERYAIMNNNSVAYQHYQNLLGSKARSEQLYHYCLAFLVATSLNYYAYTINGSALFSIFTVFFEENENSTIDGLYSLPFYALYLFSFYFGVIRGCRLSLQEENKYYLSDNDFK